jgi:hypothetical protein
VDDPLVVGVGHGLEHLLGKVDSGGHPDAALHPLGEGALTQGIGHHEATFDELGVLDGQDVGVVQGGGEAHLFAKPLQELRVHEAPMGDLERHPDALHPVEGPVDLGEAALGEALLDAVFPEDLSGPEHDLSRSDLPRCGYVQGRIERGRTRFQPWYRPGRAGRERVPGQPLARPRHRNGGRVG